MSCWFEAGVTERALGSMSHKVLGVRPPRTLASKTGGQRAIAKEAVHARATQGQSDGEQAVERVGGHVCADAGSDEHLGARCRADRFMPGALAARLSTRANAAGLNSGCAISD